MRRPLSFCAPRRADSYLFGGILFRKCTPCSSSAPRPSSFSAVSRAEVLSASDRSFSVKGDRVRRATRRRRSSPSSSSIRRSLRASSSASSESDAPVLCLVARLANKSGYCNKHTPDKNNASTVMSTCQIFPASGVREQHSNQNCSHVHQAAAGLTIQWLRDERHQGRQV